MAPPDRTNTANAPQARKSAAARGLAEILDNRKAPGLLLPDIRAHVVEQANRPRHDRDTDVLHPSEICKPKWCPRAAAYALRHRIAPVEHIHFQLASIFQYGHDAHARWQRWAAQLGMLEGDWHCRSRDRTFYAYAPTICAVCGGGDYEYDELRLHSEQLLMKGRTDGYVPEHKTLIEIKTIGEGTVRLADPLLLAAHTLQTERGAVVDLKGLWNAIHRPFTSHLKQGLIYLHLAREMGLDVEKISFIYDSKLTQGAKEFVVSYDYSIIAAVLEGAAAVKRALDTPDQLPACRFPGSCAQCQALA